VTASGANTSRRGEEGFLLVGVIVAIALVLLFLSIAAPKVAFELRREQELETIQRGQQYVRAIRKYYGLVGSYPTTMEQLEKTNNQRFLRQRYIDPLTGKSDWRLIAVGQNKTTVKGFFGQPLGGLAGGGLGSAPGAAGAGAAGATGATGSTGASGATGDDSSSTGSSFGGSSFGSSYGASGATGSTGSGFGSGFGSGDSVGPFMGVGIPKDKKSLVTLNQMTNYIKWEFIYDPRIEQLYAKASLLGGGLTSSTNSNSLGSASGIGSGIGGASGSTGSSFGSSGSPGSGSGSGGSGGGSSSGSGSGSSPNSPATPPQQ
jgi:type II secretory pathway pseudopilin PulG